MKRKSLIVALTLMLCSFHLIAQNSTFTLSGKLTQVSSGTKIYLYYYGSKIFKDSAIIQNGAFEFKGDISSPVTAQLLLLHDAKKTKLFLPLHGELDFLNLYLDKGEIKVNGTDSVKHLVITNSKINEEDQKLSQILNVPEKKILSIKAAFEQAPVEKRKDQDFRDASDNELREIIKEIQFAKFHFAKDHPDSYVSLYAIYDLALHREFDYNLLDAAYKTLSVRYKETPLANNTKQLIFTGLNTTVGSQAHNFTLTDVNGKVHRLSDFKGKYVQLEFWASWCAPCRKENPNLVNAYEKYKDKNFTIVAVSVDTKRDAWLKALDEDKIPYLQLSDLKGPRVSEAAVFYRVEGIPASYLIDPSGKIIGKNLRGEELNKKLKELFN